METKVYLVQKQDTPPPKDTVVGHITDQMNKSGKAAKFKKDREGKTYRIKWVSPPSDPWGDFGNVTYYLTIEDAQGSLGSNAVAPGKLDDRPSSPWEKKAEERLSRIEKEVFGVLDGNKVAVREAQGLETASQKQSPSSPKEDDISNIPF